MLNPFNKHLAGCTPLAKCANCHGIEYLKEHLFKKEVDEFLGMLSGSDCDSVAEFFGKHAEDCSPAIPCAHCETYVLLQNYFHDSHGWVNVFLNIFIDDVSLTPTAEEIAAAEAKNEDLNETLIEDIPGYSDLPIRLRGALKNSSYSGVQEIQALSDLTRVSRKELWRIPNLGNRSLDALEAFLESIGSHLRKS